MTFATRYARHLRLPFCGEAGQERVSRARVLLVGAGGLGCPVALYLAGAGVGSLWIADDDRVEVSNLHRQVAYSEADVGRPKAVALVERCLALNSSVEGRPLVERVHSRVLRDLLRGNGGAPFDLVVDASDNAATRYLVSDACYLEGVPHLFGAVNRTYGQIAFLEPATGGCLRALFGEEPPYDAFPSCDEVGVLGPVPGFVGTAMATEALQWIIDGRSSLDGRLLLVETRGWEFQDIRSAPARAAGPDAALRALVEGAVREREAISLTWEEVGPGVALPLGAGVGFLASRATPSPRAAPAPLWLDVRESPEARALPLPAGLAPAVHVPLSAWDPRALGEAAEGRTVLCVCRSGVRSHEAARRLRGLGFDARSLVGGLRTFPRGPAGG